MATVREGKQGVLVVVDVQVGVMAEAWDADRVVANVALAVERARAADVPVVWVQHAGDDLTPDTPEWQLAPQLSVGEGEPVTILVAAKGRAAKRVELRRELTESPEGPATAPPTNERLMPQLSDQARPGETVFALTLPAAQESFRYSASSGRARSKAYFIQVQRRPLGLQLANKITQHRDLLIQPELNSSQSRTDQQSAQMIWLLFQDFLHQHPGFLILARIKCRLRHDSRTIHAFCIHVPKLPRTSPHPVGVPVRCELIRQAQPIQRIMLHRHPRQHLLRSRNNSHLL